MKIKKISSAGFTHGVMLMAFVVVFAIVGAGYVVASHAADCTKLATVEKRNKCNQAKAVAQFTAAAHKNAQAAALKKAKLAASKLCNAKLVAYPTSQATVVYHFIDPITQDHTLSLSNVQTQKYASAKHIVALKSNRYRCESRAFRAFATQLPGTIPVYALITANNYHIYTADPSWLKGTQLASAFDVGPCAHATHTAINDCSGNPINEGIAFYAYPSAAADRNKVIQMVTKKPAAKKYMNSDYNPEIFKLVARYNYQIVDHPYWVPKNPVRPKAPTAATPTTTTGAPASPTTTTDPTTTDPTTVGDPSDPTLPGAFDDPTLDAE